MGLHSLLNQRTRDLPSDYQYWQDRLIGYYNDEGNTFAINVVVDLMQTQTGNLLESAMERLRDEVEATGYRFEPDRTVISHRPVGPLGTAAYTESYTIRYDAPPHIRPTRLTLNWETTP